MSKLERLCAGHPASTAIVSALIWAGVVVTIAFALPWSTSTRLSVALGAAVVFVALQSLVIFEGVIARIRGRARNYAGFFVALGLLVIASGTSGFGVYKALNWLLATLSQQAAQQPHLTPQPLPDYIKLTLIFLFGISLVSPLIVLAVRYAEARRDAFSTHHGNTAYDRERRDEEWRRANAELVMAAMVHFIPFAIMALAMLFAYKDLASGSAANGMASVGSIMILFLLSQLGASLLSVSTSMRSRAQKLETVAAAAQDHLRAVGIIKVYAAILRAFRPERTAVAIETGASIERLLGVWKEIAYVGLNEESGEPVEEADAQATGRLLRAILAAYLAEEHADLSATLEADRVPSPVFMGTRRQGKKPIYIATNVGFFATALARAIDALGVARNDKRPCVVSVTTVLPSWWWNWPRSRAQDTGKRHPYAPVADYRDALFAAVDDHDARVFRLVLVRGDENTGDRDYEEAVPDMKAWELESHWSFLLDDQVEPPVPRRFSGSDDDTNLATVFSDKGPAALDVPKELTLDARGEPFWVLNIKNSGHFKYAPAKPYAPQGDARFADCLKPIVGQGTGNQDDKIITRIVRYYSERLHRPVGQWTGDTRVCRTTKDLHAKMGRRTDMTFLGLVSDGGGDGARPPDWPVEKFRPQLALLGLLRACDASETMFLTVVYEPKEVEELWRNARSAIKDHEGAIVSSASEWVS